MRIRRIDKIVANNISYSSKANTERQIVYTLQDISETLAMIYDKLCASEETVIDDSTHVIDYDDIEKYKVMYFESVDYKQGYTVEFVEKKTTLSEDGKHVRESIVLSAFGENMPMPKSMYKKNWRLWTKEPTEAERNSIAWK